jgi:hypothetical protein
VGEIDTENDGGGVIVSCSDIVVEACLANRVAVTEVDTLDDVTVNVAEVEPAGMVTEVGVVAYGLFDDKKIIAPPAPAGPLSVTVPVEE